MSVYRGSLAVQVAGLDFQNPIVLAAGTAAYGRELEDIVDLTSLGGLVTKAVSPEPRAGAPAPRVAEFDGGMINAVGLANPGVAAVRRRHLPWLATSLPEYAEAREHRRLCGRGVRRRDRRAGRGGRARLARCARRLRDQRELPEREGGRYGVRRGPPRHWPRWCGARALRRRRPLFVKLSPTLTDIARSAAIAAEHGADAITLVNTIPGLVIDVERRRRRWALVPVA